MKKSQELVLSNSSIDSVCRDIEDILKKNNVPSKERIKVCLKAEEIMSFYLTRQGAGKSFVVKYSMGFDKHISFMFEGEAVNPFKDVKDEFLENLIKMLGETEHWQYKYNTNIIDIKIPKKPLSQISKIGIALALAVLFAALCMWLLPTDTINSIRETVFSPLSDLLISVLRSAACILIFTSIVMGTVNIGDIQSFKKMGKSLFTNIFLFYFISVVTTFACMLPWLNISFGNGVALSNSFKDLLKTVLDMIPSNPISPFIEGNAVQVIVLAIFCGAIFSILGEKVKTVKLFLQEFDTFISCVIEKINYLLPLLIFVVVENTALGNNISSFLSYKTIAFMWLLAFAVQFALNLICVSVFGKMSIVSYFKKAKEPLMIALLTSSSAVTLPSNMETCRKQLGIDDRLVDFGIPIGQVLYMPCSAVVMIASCVGVSSVSGMTVSVAWIITAFIISIIMSIATPPTPGSVMMVYSLLFAQMGLPEAYFGVVIALGVLTDSIDTLLNVFSLQCLLLKLSNKKKSDA